MRTAALQQYRDIVTSTDENLPLLHCAILIAKHRYPDLEESVVTSHIHNLAQQVTEQLAGNRYPLKIIRTINEVLYSQHGFKGNNENYYDPDNSCINRVLENRTGIPISLCLVYMEVAAAVGLPMVGLNLPCHLMIRPLAEGVEVLVDAFNGGEVCYLEDVEQLLSRLMGAQVQIDPRFLEPGRHIPDRMFLLRMLNNLKQLYLLTQQFEPALWIIRYMRATEPASLDFLREEGTCLFYLDRHSEAEAALKLYLQLSPKAFDALKIQAMLDFMASVKEDGSSSELSGLEQGSAVEGSDL